MRVGTTSTCASKAIGVAMYAGLRESIVAVCLLGGFGADLGAQDSVPWPAGNRLAVTLSAVSASVRGDTVRLVYQLWNAPTSEQATQHIAIRTFVPEYKIGGPARWNASPGMVQDSTAALWSALRGRPDVQPGQTLGGFWFEGVGLPDIVPMRVQGRYELPAYDDSRPWLVRRAPSFWANSAAGYTVGVVPPPAARDRAALVARLIRLTSRACDLEWITRRGVCESLQAKLDNAVRHLGAGQLRAVKEELEAFVNELEAQHGTQPGKHVSDNAYWLLRTNTAYLLALL